MKHIVSRTIVVAVSALSLGLGALAPAAALRPLPSYPLPPCSVTTNQSTYSPGDIAAIGGSGGVPGGVITFTITFDGGGSPVVLVGNVDANGNTLVFYTWPNRPGGYSIVAACPESQSPPTEIDVTPLPQTGSDVWNILRAGGVLVLLGAGLFLVARTRRRQPAAA
jgi:LPXTG-motif cell wall-anchored protein